MQKRTLGRFVEEEGAAVATELHDDLTPEHLAAMMLAISDYAQLRGWNPGTLARHYSDLEMKRRVPGANGIIPVR